jgi:hypothetical protein
LLLANSVKLVLVVLADVMALMEAVLVVLAVIMAAAAAAALRMVLLGLALQEQSVSSGPAILGHFHQLVQVICNESLYTNRKWTASKSSCF